MSDVQERLTRFMACQPALGKGVFVASSARLIGAVTLGDGASVWCHTTLRADINEVRVGAGSNIQDNCVLHVADDYPCIVGDYVTVGHSAVIHACTIQNEVLIGMGAIVLDGAVIGEQSLVGAKALVTGGTRIPPGSLVLGAPAKVVRPLTDAEKAKLRASAEKYIGVAAFYLARGIPA